MITTSAVTGLQLILPIPSFNYISIGEKMKKNVFTKLVTLLCVTALALSAMLGLASCKSEDKPIDFMTADLSEYITLKAEAYRDFPVDIKLPEEREGGVERLIMNLLYKNRPTDALYDGLMTLNQSIAIGDTVKILFRGYTVDENGVETEIKNSSNLTGSSYASVNIGQLSYIEGFEEGLIGKNPKDYPKFEKIEIGKVAEGDVVYLSYTLKDEEGNTVERKTSERIELGMPGIDERYGAGFEAHLIGKIIGAKSTEAAKFTLDGKEVSYTDVTVTFVTKCEKNPLTVDVYFPEDYSEASLRGVSAKFDMYIDGVYKYDTPAFDEKFIKETLKVTEEELADYEGANLVEKYTSKLKEEYKESVEASRATLIEQEFWKHVKENVVIKSLPEYEVNTLYNGYIEDLELRYASYSSYYKTIEEFARAYYGLGSNEDYKKHLKDMSEETVAQQIMFYTVIKQEGFIPTDAEYKALYEEAVQERVDYHCENTSAYINALKECKSEEERTAKLAEIRAEIIENYGDAYFKESIYYDYGIEKILGFAKIGEAK